MIKIEIKYETEQEKAQVIKTIANKMTVKKVSQIYKKREVF